MRTSNEWMQKAGELEAEVERLREETANPTFEYLARLRRIEEAARAVDRLVEIDEDVRINFILAADALRALRAALEEKP